MAEKVASLWAEVQIETRGAQAGLRATYAELQVMRRSLELLGGEWKANAASIMQNERNLKMLTQAVTTSGVSMQQWTRTVQKAQSQLGVADAQMANNIGTMGRMRGELSNLVQWWGRILLFWGVAGLLLQPIWSLIGSLTDRLGEQARKNAELAESFNELIPRVKDYQDAIEGIQERQPGLTDRMVDFASSLAGVFDRTGDTVAVLGELRQGMEDTARAEQKLEGQLEFLRQPLSIIAEHMEEQRDEFFDTARSAQHYIQSLVDAGLANEEVLEKIDDTTMGLLNQAIMLRRSELMEEHWADGKKRAAREAESAGRRIEDAAFRRQQAEENFVFRTGQITERFNIQQWASQARFSSQRLAAQERFNLTMHTIMQRHFNRLQDLQVRFWNNQRDLLRRQAPPWLQAISRNFLKKRAELMESGDEEGLRQLQKAFKDRVREIDPIFAEELDILEESLDQQRSAEDRNYQQSIDNQRRAFDIQLGAMQRAFAIQNETQRRNLALQLDAAKFSYQQQLEAIQRFLNRADEELREGLIKMKQTIAKNPLVINIKTQRQEFAPPLLPQPVISAPGGPIPFTQKADFDVAVDVTVTPKGDTGDVKTKRFGGPQPL
ncbi:MAG: hypothetical protein GTO63_27635 [Anaerolineae bacterium]|nr:hypothetical protein [Anaerolineae bacterium]NIN98503.1 hypothetical protein [Anaerolineae bacterium]